MSEVKWIKLCTDIFDNRKIKLIEAMPEGDTIIVIWTKLLCLAGKTNNCGMLQITREIPYTDQELATTFNRPLQVVQLALKTFEYYGMIDVIEEFWHISNWEKYQNVIELDDIREQTRLRVKKYRERNKIKALQEGKSECNATVALHECYNDVTVTEQNKNKNKNNIYSVNFDELWSVYPRKKEKAGAYKAYLARIKEGVSHDELLKATLAYRDECNDKGRSEEYIKHAKTFFGSSRPYEDYLRPSNKETNKASEEERPLSSLELLAQENARAEAERRKTRAAIGLKG